MQELLHPRKQYNFIRPNGNPSTGGGKGAHSPGGNGGSGGAGGSGGGGGTGGG